MEPKLPTPSSSPEVGGYKKPEAPSVVPERTAQPSAEAQPSGEERLEVQQPGPADPVSAAPVFPQPVLPTPPPAPAASTTSAPVSDHSNPLIAADDDLIEKEWVDRAKKIVQQTKTDPYAQEKEVSKLQADYIKKRYGKDIKLTSN